ENGYDAFSTTLLVSPYQNDELIIVMAEEAGKEFDFAFYYEDFRKGYQRGVDISLELELYRQPYCGCVFSERDRYEKKPKVKLD
ncbi:epoxyqueuosine reductase QueH, partial [Phascolarctobacterium faecium]|uniref:epoxyqueuosine reductase QueH n=1 Tax=Phascolarctobacterium faecium TaxID=33025 RepID=UPI0040251111